MSNSLSLIACLTINHFGAAGLPNSSSHIGYTYRTSVTLNFTFTGTGVKNCATLTLPALGVWMIVARGLFNTAVDLNVQCWNGIILAALASAFNANPPTNTQSIYFASGNTGYGLAQVTTTTVGSPKVTTVYHTYTHIASKKKIVF